MKTKIELVKSKKNGIRYSLMIFGLILSISVSSTGLKSQDISTVGEIYDYEIGDIFHFYFLGNGPGFGDASITNIEILNKYYSRNNDTMFYIRDIDRMTSSMENPDWVYDYYIDTIFYFNLDSLINMGQIDSVYTDLDLYNGRLINYVTIEEYSTTFKSFAVGCGQTINRYISHDFTTEAETRLIYYKKGNEEWGNQIIVSIFNPHSNNSDIIVYPNPAKSIINIISKNGKTFDLKIFTLFGELVKTIKLNSELKTIDISKLKAGIYLLVIRKNDKIIYKKLIKE